MSSTKIPQVCIILCLMHQHLLAGFHYCEGAPSDRTAVGVPPPTVGDFNYMYSHRLKEHDAIQSSDGIVHKQDLEALEEQFRVLKTRTEIKLAETDRKLRQSEEKQKESVDKQRQTEIHLGQTELKLAGTEKKLKLTESMLKRDVDIVRARLLRNSDSIRRLMNTTADSTRSILNTKVCYWHNPDKREDQGALLSCQGEKLREHTVLKISFSGSLRVDGVPGQHNCRRWWLMVNSTECSNKIDAELWNYSQYHTNYYRPAYITGYCQNVAVGPVTVTFNVGPCVIIDGGGQPGDAITGIGSAVYITIEEVHGVQIHG